MKHSAVVFRLQEANNDWKFKSKGARKQIVTDLFKDEKFIYDPEWTSGLEGSKCPVVMMEKTESAVFNQNAKQDCHCHMVGTEMYIVLEGAMRINVEDKPYDLVQGDMIVVNPGSWHEVKPEGANFLCRVITVDCIGNTDKYIKEDHV